MRSKIWKSFSAAAALLAMLCIPALGQAKAAAAGLDLAGSSKAALLMEQQTGEVLYQKNADSRHPIASVTKVMTLCLVMEQMEQGHLKESDKIEVSQNAQNMGGSQVFLEAGGQYTAKELLKAVIVASANDASVAFAEALAGNEDAFVVRMNEKAKQWGMTNTNFTNCTGLPDKNAYSSARDVAIMSRKLLGFKRFFQFSTIWTDSIKHPGGRITEIANTNKLVRFYSGCDGLKTGSTSEAGFCLTASASRGSVRYIAVVLGSDTSQNRFYDARTLLNYGFANYSVKQVADGKIIPGLQVNARQGVTELIPIKAIKPLACLTDKGDELRVQYDLPSSVQAPIQENQKLGIMRVFKGDKLVAEVELVAAADCRKLTWFDRLKKIIGVW